MILGILDQERPASQLKQDLLDALARVSAAGKERVEVSVWAGQHVALCAVPLRIATLDEVSQPFQNRAGTISLVFEGKIYNLGQLEGLLGREHQDQPRRSGHAVVQLYERYGADFLDRVNGKFCLALWDASAHRLLLARDRLGGESLFYFSDGERLLFASSLRALMATGWTKAELCHDAILQYLLYCYNPGDATLVRGVRRLPPGHLLSSRGSGISVTKFWHLCVSEVQQKSEQQYREEILQLIEDAVRVRLEPDAPPGVFLSGGTDSSALVGLAAKLSGGTPYTFSFRCRGRSYDESQHARFVATHYGTQHTEIAYEPEDLSLISGAVEWMDEPFCDLGIELGTFLLGRAASGKVSYVFSGEGGDELFGGHPVYVADKVAAVVDRLPRAVVRSVADTLKRLRDSDNKNDLRVKLRRFAYGLSFPDQLLSHRWRIYYTPEEVQALCTGDFIAECDLGRLYDDMLKYGREANGTDRLNRSLYSDYHTLVAFYLQRLRLLRAFSIDSRLPLLDQRLVDYAARIPSELKIRGLSDSKHIYKKALAGLVPQGILYGRSKLGHSVPMKNWLRHQPAVTTWTADILGGQSFMSRGFFHQRFIRRLLDEHARKRSNHSHRLWALVVLELWLRAFFGSSTRHPSSGPPGSL